MLCFGLDNNQEHGSSINKADNPGMPLIFLATAAGCTPKIKKVMLASALVLINTYEGSVGTINI